MKTKDLLIGIPARNEAKTIVSTLNSIFQEIRFLPKPIKVRVIVVLNGCTDNTEFVVKEYISKNKNCNIAINKISGGLIDAQQAIWHAKTRNEIVIFVDGDIKFEKKSLLRLYKKSMDGNAGAVWSTIIPSRLPATQYLSLVRILNFRDYFPQLFEVRKYLCGRVFYLNKYPLKIANAGKYRSPGRQIESLLSLERGPIVDDIYLTRYLRLDCGLESTQNCPDSVVYFNPITTVIDFYLSQRRTVFEMYRLDLLFPEKRTSHTKKTYLKKKINSVIYQNLPFINKVECNLYLCIYDIVRKIAYVELKLRIWLAQNNIYSAPINIWPIVKSSKIELD